MRSGSTSGAISAVISKPMASSSSIRTGASPGRCAPHPTRLSPAATTSAATMCCATSSMSNGSTAPATSRSPAGHFRGCASTMSRNRSRSRFRRSTHASSCPARSRAAKSWSRPTASPFCGSTARIPSAPSPAPNGICARSRPWGRKSRLPHSRVPTLTIAATATRPTWRLTPARTAGNFAASARWPQICAGHSSVMRSAAPSA